jgi:dTDP-4-amino-4,6-dideoxygalactose transaminase
MGQPASLMYQNQRAWTYDVNQLGYRYHMANLHAAIGLAQMNKINMISKTRQESAIAYNIGLKDVTGIVIPKSNFQDITPFLYYIRVLDNKRDELIKYLREKGIDTGIHWQPAHWFSLFKSTKRGDLSVTEHVGKEILSLPLHSKMQSEDQKKIISAIKNFFV